MSVKYKKIISLTRDRFNRATIYILNRNGISNPEQIANEIFDDMAATIMNESCDLTNPEEILRRDIQINNLGKELNNLREKNRMLNREIKQHIEEKQQAQSELQPAKESLNNLTAVHGKLLRKLKRHQHG